MVTLTKDAEFQEVNERNDKDGLNRKQKSLATEDRAKFDPVTTRREKARTRQAGKWREGHCGIVQLSRKTRTAATTTTTKQSALDSFFILRISEVQLQLKCC